MFDDFEFDIDDLMCCMDGVMSNLKIEFVFLCMGCVLVLMLELV